MNEYTVAKTQPWTYVNEVGDLVDGFRVFVKLTTFDEMHYVYTPSLKKEVVSKRIASLLEDRKTLSTQ